jgi:hypothetical protein
MKNTRGGSEIPPGRLSYNIKSFAFKTCFGAWTGCGDITSPHKNLVKNRKTNFLRLTIQEPIFPVSDTEFEGGGDVRGCGDCIVLVK